VIINACGGSGPDETATVTGDGGEGDRGPGWRASRPPRCRRSRLLGLAPAIAAMQPVGIAVAALGVASVGVNIGWRIPSQGHPPQAIAMFHDARKHFG
jgi:hypothetical protein